MKYSEIEGKTYSEIFNMQKEDFHAKQQLADFTKAAMQGLCSMDVALQDNELFIAETACKIARATIDEMIRREKEDEARKD